MVPAEQRRHPTASHTHADQNMQMETERDIARAEDDYQRLRRAYLDLARNQPNEVAMAMVGADMDRAHASLQHLTGLRQLPFTHESTSVVRREAMRLVEEDT